MNLTIKRVDRLVGISVLGSLLTVWLVLTGFDAVTQFLRQLKHVGHGFTTLDALTYVLVTLPRRLYEMFIFAAVIGGLMGLGGLGASGELTALRAAGMSRLRIAASAAGVVAVLVVAVTLMGETIAPLGDQKAQAMQVRLKTGDIGLSGATGLWARDGNRMVNARTALLKREGDHNVVELHDVRVFELTPAGRLARFQQASVAEHDGRRWQLRGVRDTTLDATGVHTVQHPGEPWQVNLDARVLEQSMIQPQYLPMRDLWRNMQYLQRNGQNPGVYAVPFWGRALYPFNALVLVLCAMPFAFGALRSGGLGKRIFFGILLAIGWYFMQQALVNFATIYGVPALPANLLPAGLLVLAAWLYFRRRT